MAEGFNPSDTWAPKGRGFNIGVVQQEFLRDESAPVSTSVMIAGLGHEDFLVELTPIAVVPPDRFVQPS